MASLFDLDGTNHYNQLARMAQSGAINQQWSTSTSNTIFYNQPMLGTKKREETPRTLRQQLQAETDNWLRGALK